MTRSYDQYCPVAATLDVIGERWTLLIVRDLLMGPKRYTDLQDGLPGISPNILAERLRDLQAAGVVDRRKLRPPAASVVYELTERGRELETVIVTLARWGLPLLDREATPEQMPSIDPFVMGLKVLYQPDQDRPAATYELHIDEEVYAVQTGPEGLFLERGEVAEPALRVHTDRVTWASILVDGASLKEAAGRGRLRFEGRAPRAAVRRFAETFTLSA